jgi:hypothetical protein
MIVQIIYYLFSSVVLDAPTGMNSDAWSLVFDKVAKYTRVSKIVT